MAVESLTRLNRSAAKEWFSGAGRTIVFNAPTVAGSCAQDPNPDPPEAERRGEAEVVVRVELMLGEDPDPSVIAGAADLAAAIPPTAQDGSAMPVFIEYP
ncbi:MAG: hypothetical protein K1X67_20305 [Fimbriimonadaceae bacterium]|nr:hypothetical protein [Fimbriimonadaceae bacterium]